MDRAPDAVAKSIIPDAALGQHIAVLGKTGSGKTFAAKASIIEPLLERGRRVGVVDPTDAWWGLRSSRDGKGPGFPVLVLGDDIERFVNATDRSTPTK